MLVNTGCRRKPWLPSAKPTNIPPLVWSVTSSQVVYFQHPLAPKKLRRGKPARRLAAQGLVAFNQTTHHGKAGLVCDFQSSRVFSTSAGSQKAAAWEARSSACGSKSQTVQSGVSRWPGWSVTSFSDRGLSDGGGY